MNVYAHVHIHVTLCETLSTSATVKHGCTTLKMLYMLYGKQSAVKYGNPLDLS